MVNVLVVDDQPANLLAVEATLADLDLNVVRAGSWFEALRCLLDADYSAEAAPPLQPGETVLLLTDGIVEAHGSDEDLFGTERVLQLVKAHRHRPAREILNTLFGAVRDFCGPVAQPDDMTAIIIKAGAAPEAPGGAGPEAVTDAVFARKSGS